MQLLIRPLTLADTDLVFQFEQQNRAYFETYIESRGEAFYRQAGVYDHICELLALYQKGQHVSMLITDAEGQLLGRVNISQIDAVSASGSLGYRIAEQHTGKGVASRAVKYALEIAREHGLVTLNAMASTTNIASQTVLERNGFNLCDKKFNVAYVAGELIDYLCYCNKLSSV
ncbi:GNAT family N-acetyltransferase [Salinivibrio sp. HTSP]|uniref:GNAT family N-acetyltransferase n=1 Tax=Salinivibrio sp. HTSP TaxID=2115977 RepID=UPI000E3129A5|nr:GNAT family N-acetyltransferase [Salinivibrio sp. HTSP]